jgi:hypothetical protein
MFQKIIALHFSITGVWHAKVAEEARKKLAEFAAQ